MRAKLCLVVLSALAACGEVKPDATDAATEDAAVDAPIDSPPGADPTITVTRSGTAGGTVTSNAGGISCGAQCSGQVPLGTVVVLTALPDGNAIFGGWTGPCTGTSPTCTFTASADTAVGAAFNIAQRTVTVALAGNGLGTVTSPGGLNCPGTCSITVDHGTSVTITATPNSGSVFLGWSGAGCTGTAPCTLTVDGDESINASFALNQTLVVTRTGNGTGTVTSSPAGISCGADCNETYAPGTTVTLTAAAAANSTFTGWSGGGCSGTGTCVVTVNAATTVNADFMLQQHTLLVNRNGTGTGTVTSSPSGISCGADCTEAYNAGTTVTLTAAAASGSTFAGWSGGGCSGTGTCVVTMNAAASVTATFNVNSYTLTVTRAGAGTGTVTSSPAGINCGTDCTESYNHGTAVTLTATAGASSTFAGWLGGSCSGTGTCVVTMTAATSITATFNAVVVQPNIAFVTSSIHTGNLGGLAGADTICAQRAAAAGLAGTYRAYLSQPGTNAISRLGSAAGWVRTDGRPFAQTTADIAAGRLFYPLAVNESGVALPNRDVWSGTNPQGQTNDNACNNWTSTTPTGITSGTTDGATSGWVFRFGSACTEQKSIYCFGVDRTATLTITPASGRRQFLTANPWAVGGGIASADAACQADATAAGLPGTYRALLATNGASAMSRFNTSGSGFVRTDGIQVTATPAAFFGTAPFLTQPSVAANGTSYCCAGNQTSGAVWAGAPTMTTAGTATTTCNNWTTTTGTVNTGEVNGTFGSQLFGSATFVGCNGSARLVCLQE